MPGAVRLLHGLAPARPPADRPTSGRPGSSRWRRRSSPGWLIAGTGLEPGDSLGQLAGREVDSVDPLVAQPDGNRVIAAGSCPSAHGTVDFANAALHRTAAGGRVFASGTLCWAWSMDPRFAAARRVVLGFDQLTRNILAFLAAPWAEAAAAAGALVVKSRSLRRPPQWSPLGAGRYPLRPVPNWRSPASPRPGRM